MTDYLHEEHKGLLVGRAHGARYERANPSEHDVSVPPAFMIVDSEGGVWTFGYEYVERGGQFEFAVLRNDVDQGEEAYKIANVGGVVTIYGHGYGRKRWARSRKTFI